MDAEVMRKLKDTEIDMLLEFLKICQKNKLRYFVIGGTCLGAVRHQGFIPWDDDIDIGMPRKDYNKFLDLAQDELPSHLFVQNYKTEKNLPFNFTKIRNSHTTFVEKSIAHLDINHGVYIDIFPLDGVPDNKYLKKINDICLVFLNLGLTGYYFKDIKRMRLRSRIVRYIMKTLYTPQKIHKKIDAIVERFDYDKCDLVRNYFGAWGEKEMVPKEYFGKGCVLPFEKISVVAPLNYDKYLKSLYGNYMMPPPKEKQISHHEKLVIDLNNSYILH